MLKITSDGHVFLRGQEIDRVTGLEIKIDPPDRIKVAIYTSVDRIDVGYHRLLEKDSDK